MRPASGHHAIRPPQFTIARFMVMVAIVAAIYALLPLWPSIAMTTIVLGIFGLDALRLPVITEWPGLWQWLPWVVWLLAILVCPVAMGQIAMMNPHAGPPIWTGPGPPATQTIELLGNIQVVVLLAAALAVVVLARGEIRWLAWAIVLFIGTISLIIGFSAVMTTRGTYL